MKVGDLVSRKGHPFKWGGVVLEICDDLGIVTVDILLHTGSIAYDQRIESYEVVDEER